MSVKFNLNTFKSLYPNSKSSSEYLEYKVEDSQYRVYNPTVKADNVLNVKLDHIRADATDDHVELTVTFSPTGTINKVDYDWTKGDDGYQVPDKLIKVVDGTLEIIGAVGALETFGLSEELALDAKEAFDFCAKAFNEISTAIVKFNDNGGQLYFVAVVSHTINRLCSSVSAN
ncbi:hypothetical protein [Emticicia sp. W12TSBA100-4]|uniref:hypothetical protein n=1 Tax=Emticicia sp. W12TSBA100-4 TaxID=3160965 RepID=UPI003305D935